jgi:hypothetical protein
MRYWSFLGYPCGLHFKGVGTIFHFQSTYCLVVGRMGITLLLAAFVFGCGGSSSDLGESKESAERTSAKPFPVAKQPAQTVATKTEQATTAETDGPFDKLVGSWTRTDGGYVIKIRSVGSDGKLDAGYFNPRPIKVSVAKASEKAAAVEVFVELRDINYPGSNYTLTYDPQRDALVGNYFQAVEG